MNCFRHVILLLASECAVQSFVFHVFVLLFWPEQLIHGEIHSSQQLLPTINAYY